jgi:hypothetical protein
MSMSKLMLMTYAYEDEELCNLQTEAGDKIQNQKTKVIFFWKMWMWSVEWCQIYDLQMRCQIF